MERNDIVKRHKRARITAKKLNAKLSSGLEYHSIFNAGAERKIIFFRGENYTGHSSIIPGIFSKNGRDFEVRENLILHSIPGKIAHEDPRVAWIPELGLYGVAYVTWRPETGPAVSLMKVPEDLRSLEQIGNVIFVGKEEEFGKENKDASLLPGKIIVEGRSRYGLIHRPIVDGVPKIFISFCDDDDWQYWDYHEELAAPQGGTWWDADRIGLSSQPMYVPPEYSEGLPEGFLLVDHGVKNVNGGGIYRHGVMWLSIEGRKPKITHRSEEWIIGPDEVLRGDVHSVIFICASWIDGDRIIMWCGHNDLMLEKASADLRKVLKTLKPVR